MSLIKIIKIGNELRAIRKKLGLTQIEMAEALEVGQSTYANYERNNRMPSMEVFDKLESEFGINSRELINRATSEKTSSEILEKLAKYYGDCGFDTGFHSRQETQGEFERLYVRNTSDGTRLTITEDTAKEILIRVESILKESYYAEMNKR